MANTPPITTQFSNSISSAFVVEIYKSNIQKFKIQDSDGFSNLRDVPNGKVIRKVYENRFKCLQEQCYSN